MQASGLRVANEPGAHRISVIYSRTRLSDLVAEVDLDDYETLREVRNAIEYPEPGTRNVLTADDAHGDRRRRRANRRRGHSLVDPTDTGARTPATHVTRLVTGMVSTAQPFPSRVVTGGHPRTPRGPWRFRVDGFLAARSTLARRFELDTAFTGDWVVVGGQVVALHTASLGVRDPGPPQRRPRRARRRPDPTRRKPRSSAAGSPTASSTTPARTPTGSGTATPARHLRPEVRRYRSLLAGDATRSVIGGPPARRTRRARRAPRERPTSGFGSCRTPW